MTFLTPHRLDPRDSRWITAPLIRDARLWRRAYAGSPIRRAEVKGKVHAWVERRLLAHPELTLREWQLVSGYFGLGRTEPLPWNELARLAAEPGTDVGVASKHVMRLLYWLLVVQGDGSPKPARVNPMPITAGLGR